jgi:hypothetical protein
LTQLPAGAIGLVDTTSPVARLGTTPAPQLAQLQNAAAAPQLAGSPQVPTAGVQQGAISPIGLPASTQITLAKPQALPQITIAKPQALPNVSVTTAKPQQGLSVGNAKPNPKIVF